MRNFHIEIDINKDGDMLIYEDGCTGEHYRVDGDLDDLIDQITTCLADYLHCEYDDMEENDMTYKEFVNKMDKYFSSVTGFSPDKKPNNIMSTDGELKQWQEEIMERNSIMSRAEMKEFLKPKNDPVNHPSHYTDGQIEVIDFIEDKKLGFHLGNAVKYIARAGKKDPAKTVEDLEKAIWYINRYIEDYKQKDGLNARNGYFDSATVSCGDTDGDKTELFSGSEKVGEIPVNNKENNDSDRD